jgi:acetolactate synthase I/II/III large subunit
MASKSEIDGGELLVRTLVRAGTEVAFVLHGGHLDPIFQACLDHGVRLIDTRHEAAAGHAADAYARQTGKLGVAMVTAGPGFSNALTAITQAYLDCSPVLFVTGAAPLRDAEKWPLQGGIDQIAMARPVTKWAAQVTRTDQIPHLASHAIRTALSGRPGPVLLEIPIDVLFSRVPDDATLPVPPWHRSAPAPAPESVAAAIDLLASAERPVLVLGGGALHAQAAAALRTFVETTGIPVYANNKALGMLPTDHPLCAHSIGNLAVLQVTSGEQPDVAMVVGARFGMFTRGDKALPPPCQLIQIDIDGAEMGRLRSVDVPIVADAREALAALTAAAAARTWPDWTAWSIQLHRMARWHEQAYADAPSPPGTVHPYHAVREIMAALDADTIVCADGGEASQWAEIVAEARHPGQFSGHGYLGCLGIGMPFAIGAQVAHPDRRVVCIVGDGAAGLNIQEFDTMVRHGLPVVTVVLNNRAWGMCLHGQQSMYGGNRLVVTELGDCRYDQVAAGFGCHGAHVDDPGSVRDAVRAALETGQPACVNVMTDLDAAFGFQQPSAGAERRADARRQIELPYYDDLTD